MAFTENLDLFLADFGVSVTFDGAPAGAKGLWDEAGTLVLDEQGRAGVTAVEKSLLVKTSVADLLNIGSTITVGGTAYTVRLKPPVEDGAFTSLYLRG